MANEKLMNLVMELVEAGVQMNLRMEDGELRAYFEDGFYKSGLTYMAENTDGVSVYARYNEVTHVNSLEDVVCESRYWHERSMYRFDGWKDAPAHWAALYEKF
jgi:hypothetical protein